MTHPTHTGGDPDLPHDWKRVSQKELDRENRREGYSQDELDVMKDDPYSPYGRYGDPEYYDAVYEEGYGYGGSYTGYLATVDQVDDAVADLGGRAFGGDALNVVDQDLRILR